MASQTHKRPELRASVEKLLATLVPAVRQGGLVSLTALVEALAGDRLKPEVREKLDARGQVLFVLQGGQMRFSNEGPPLRIPLRRFDIKIPARISGQARLFEDGASLLFHKSETLSAAKLVFSVRLERIDVTSKQVFVDMDGDSFDQCIELV